MNTLAAWSRRIPRHFALALFGIIILLPLSLTLFTSLKSTPELYAAPLAPPSTWRFSNYRQLVQAESMLTYYKNSTVVTAATVVLVLLLGSMVAYAISRMRGWKATALFAFFLAGLMVAPQVYMIPAFVVISKLQLVNTLRGVILLEAAMQLPIAVLILTGFMRDIPREITDAAFVDGCSEWNVYRRIIVPLTTPAFATVGIFSLVISWNSLLFPLLLLRTDDMKTLPLALLQFRGQYLTNYPLLFAGVVVATIPMVIAYVALQRYFVQGMTAGSVKG